MGLMGKIFGAGAAVKEVGDAVGNVAEVFVGNQSERDASAHGRYVESVGQFRAEFEAAGVGRFHEIMDGLNRLPRPMLTLGTLSLFVYAMIEPFGFSRRMEGLALVPDPLWWLLGAIVSFYFGARELHYQRMSSGLKRRIVRRVADAAEGSIAPDSPKPEATQITKAPQGVPNVASASTSSSAAKGLAANPDFNAAFAEWRQTAEQPAG